MASPTRGSQINIYGIDKTAREKFKTICRQLGFPVNEVLVEIIEAITTAPDERHLRKFFQVMKEGS
jgi:hypothetical protein